MMRRLMAVVGVMAFYIGTFVNATHVKADSVQWSGNGHWYEAVYVPGGLLWTEARDAAASQGGYLASITSAEENAFVFSLVSDDKFWVDYGGAFGGPWLGGYQGTTPGWRWMSGEPWSYTNWSPDEPNGGFNEKALGFWSLGSKGATWGDWLDIPQQHTLGYIVESVPEPSSIVLLGIAATSLIGFGWRRRRQRG